MSTVSIRSPAGKWVLAATILASAMAFIDSTALNVVLPALQKKLHATGADIFWILNAYLLMLASLILVGGSLGDKLGRKKIFMTGIFVFICGSAACGMAPDTGWLILFRVVQGVGGALMIPGSLALLSSSIDESEKGKAIGTWSAVTTMVTMGGPVLGGALADAGLWRAIFFINVPVGIASLLILRSKVVESRDMTSLPGLDLAGAATIALGLAALTFAFLRMPVLGFRHWSVLSALTAGVVLLLVFIGIERRSKHPMMPLSLFANPVFTGVNCLTFFLYAGLGAGMLFLSLNLVQTQGYSQLESGMTFLPFTLLLISLARQAGMLSDRHGPRLFLTFGPAAAGAGLLLLSFVGQTRGPGEFWTSFLPGILVLGLGMAFTVAPLTTTVMRSVSDRHSGVASGINNAMTRISSVFANAIFGALAVGLFTGILQQRLDGMMLSAGARQEAIAQAADLGNAHVPDSVPGARRPAVEAAYRAGFISVYQKVLRLAAGVAFAGALTGWVFIRRPRTTVLLSALLLCTVAQAQLPVASERHHRIIFTNNYIRILEGHVAERDTTPAHVHAANSVVVFLSRSRFGIQNAGGKPVITDVSPGDMIYRDYGDKPVTHIVWNESPSEFHFLVVELTKSHSGGAACPTLSSPGLRFQWAKPSVTAYELYLGEKGLCRLPASGAARLLIDLSGETTVVGAAGDYKRHPEGFVFIASGGGIDIRGENARCILLEIR